MVLHFVPLGQWKRYRYLCFC